MRERNTPLLKSDEFPFKLKHRRRYARKEIRFLRLSYKRNSLKRAIAGYKMFTQAFSGDDIVFNDITMSPFEFAVHCKVWKRNPFDDAFRKSQHLQHIAWLRECIKRKTYLYSDY